MCLLQFNVSLVLDEKINLKWLVQLKQKQIVNK